MNCLRRGTAARRHDAEATEAFAFCRRLEYTGEDSTARGPAKMTTHGTAAAIGALLPMMLSATCGAQGLSLIENCPANIEPIERPPPTLPVGREHTYHVTARFIIDVNGTVIAPSVKASQLIFAGTGAVPVPPDVDRTFLDALRKWRYARRSKPCLGSVELEFQHVI